MPPARACAIALAAAEAVGGDLVGVDLLPADADSWTVLEVNGAVDFTATYTVGDEVFSTVRDALLAGWSHTQRRPPRRAIAIMPAR